jgi:hypothetical protein
VIIEYNSLFGPELAVTIPYQQDFNRRAHGAKGYYGASLQALAHLAVRKGYRLVAVEPRGVNAYFLRNDAASHVPACDPRTSFRGLEKIAYRNVREKADGDLLAYFTKRGLPLVDVTQTVAAGS